MKNYRLDQLFQSGEIMPVQPLQKNEKPSVFFEKRGTGDNLILCIHGFGLNRKSWYDIADSLGEKATVYMIDLIGSGNSPAPERWPYSIESQAETIFNFILEKALSNITLIGHSYGGGVSLMLVHQMMERGLGDLVKRMVLIAPAAFPQPLPFFMLIPRIPFVGAFLLKWTSAEFQIKTTLKRVFYNSQTVTPEKVNTYKSNISRPAYRNALIRTAQNVLPGKTDHILEKISQIKIPSLLIYGKNESVISKDKLEKLSWSLPGVKKRIIANCGHVPHEEYPQMVADMITGFLITA